MRNRQVAGIATSFLWQRAHAMHIHITDLCASRSDIMTSQNLFTGAFASVFALKRSAQVVLVALTVFATSQATASTITYAVSIFESVGPFTLGIGGSITTDGTLGLLTPKNIIDWDLIGAAQETPNASIFNLVGPLSGGPNSTVTIGTNIIATPSTLQFDPNGPAGGLNFIGPTVGISTELILFLIDNPNALSFLVQGPMATAQIGVANPSSFVFADAKGLAPSAVPLPAALPLFATGLVGLVLLGWRRKKKGT
jgi:hypothetical protein